MLKSGKIEWHLQYNTNLEGCEECRKSEPLKAWQQHESATTTWARTFITYSVVVVQAPCHCFIRCNIVFSVSFTAELMLCTVEIQSHLL
jgi:hypothetical protein